jgi:hypothetical protein
MGAMSFVSYLPMPKSRIADADFSGLHAHRPSAEEVKISASIGVACFPVDAQSPEVLLEKADEAMNLLIVCKYVHGKFSCSRAWPQEDASVFASGVALCRSTRGSASDANRAHPLARTENTIDKTWHVVVDVERRPVRR